MKFYINGYPIECAQLREAIVSFAFSLRKLQLWPRKALFLVSGYLLWMCYVTGGFSRWCMASACFGLFVAKQFANKGAYLPQRHLRIWARIMTFRMAKASHRSRAEGHEMLSYSSWHARQSPLIQYICTYIQHYYVHTYV